MRNIRQHFLIHGHKQTILRKQLVSILFILVLFSCSRPDCKNTNEIFERSAPDKEEYKKELASEMQRIGVNNLRYWIDKPVNVGGKQLIEVYIQGQGLCAKGQLFIEDSAKLPGRGNYGAGGYRGAEMKEVDIEINKDSAGTNFILQQVGRIID